LTDKTLREATDSIAVVQAIAGSGNVVGAVVTGLRKAAAMANEDAPTRRELLRSVADKIGQSAEHAMLVHAFIGHIDALPPAARADARAALEKSENSAEAAQPLVHHLLALAQALPIDQLGPVPLQLAQKMEAASEPSEAFDRTWNHAMQLAEATTAEQAGPMVTLLANMIPNLTPEARQKALDRTMALIGTFPPSERSEIVLAKLAKTVHLLPELAPEPAYEGPPGRAAAVHKIMESIAGVGDKHRALVLHACAAAMEHVTHQRRQVFDDTLEAIKGLPGNWMRASCLKALIQAGRSTAHDGSGNELSKILQCVDGLEEEDLVGVVLNATAAFKHIEHPGLLPLLVLDQIQELPSRDQELVLRVIFRNVPWTAMSSEDLARNTRSALSALSKLPMDDRHSGAVARCAAFCLPILTMEAGEQAATFATLLQQAERRPGSELLRILSKTMHEAHDRGLQRQGFAPLLRLAGKKDPVALEAVRHLADQLVNVPDGELQATWNEMRTLVDRVLAYERFDVGDLDHVIAGLAENLSRLESQSLEEALAWVQQSIPRLFEKTDSYGSASKALLKLASAVPALPEDLRLSPFDTALTHVADVLAADGRADSDLLIDYDDGGRQMRRDERGAALLAQLAEAAGSLPKLAPRAAVSQILAGLQGISDDASRVNVLKSLALDALPAALARSVKFGMRASDPLKRHVSRDLLLKGFVKEVERLPPEARLAVLQQMLENAHAATNTSGESARPKDDKSAKLPALLEGLLQKAETAALRA